MITKLKTERKKGRFNGYEKISGKTPFYIDEKYSYLEIYIFSIKARQRTYESMEAVNILLSVKVSQSINNMIDVRVCKELAKINAA